MVKLTISRLLSAGTIAATSHGLLLPPQEGESKVKVMQDHRCALPVSCAWYNTTTVCSIVAFGNKRPGFFRGAFFSTMRSCLKSETP